MNNNFKFDQASFLDREHQAYEHFKLLWMLDHGFTLKDLIQELEKIKEESDTDISLKSIFLNWETNYGFDSEIYPCFEEFLDCEYHECGYDKEEI